MTVIGPRTAVVSVGVSCQTAYQLRYHRHLLSNLLSEEMQVARTPFEWMLTPVRSAAAIIREGDYFPYDLGELDWCRHPYWPRHDCFFWHEDLAFDHPSYFQVRFQRAAERLERVRDAERRIFIVSNTQNAIGGIVVEAGGFDFHIDDGGLDVLQAALDERYGPSELYAVTAWHDTGAAPSDRVFAPRRDKSVWKGARSLWAEVLRTIVLDRGAGRRAGLAALQANSMLTMPNPRRRASVVSGSTSHG